MNTAVRTVDRWALLAGVTGMVANLLLIALSLRFLPGAGAYSWTGPANDVIGGVVSTAATIPVALALLTVLGAGRGLRIVTSIAVAAMAVMVGSSLLLVAGALPFEIQVWIAVPAIVAMFAWVFGVGRAGRRLPGRLGRQAELIGGAGIAAVPLAGLAALMPVGSAPQYLVGSLAGVIGVPAYLVFPAWLIALANRLPLAQSGVAGPHDGRGPVRDLQLGDDVGDVVAHGLATDR
jgi:hypothetical protein